MLETIGRMSMGAVAQGLIYGILALGVYITFKLLDFADLTVDNSMCTGGAVCTMLLINDYPMWFALCLAFIAGMLAGAITGFLHTTLKIPAILAGILTQLALYSINMRIMGGKANQAFLRNPELVLPGEKAQVETLVAIGNSEKTILAAGLIVLGVVIVLYWFFGTEIGCAIRATGNNGKMARALGVSTGAMTVMALMLSNGLVALSGALFAQYMGSSDINHGRGAIVIGLASVIIGEVVFGTRFNFFYCLCSIVGGSVIYQFVMSLVTLTVGHGLISSDKKMISAVLVVIAMAMPVFKDKWKASKNAKALSRPAQKEAQ